MIIIALSNLKCGIAAIKRSYYYFLKEENI
nr:MAG TPA: hypothetical protein [Caudoviricetes sp.]